MRRRDWLLPPAVIVGLDNITGLQTARILHARGVPVFGVVSDARHWAARTHVCVQVLQSAIDREELVRTLLELAQRIGTPSVLIPCTDGAVEVVSHDRGALAGRYLLPLSPHRTVELLADKAAFARHAAKRGLPVPRTVLLRSGSEAVDIAADLSYPCVLKPPVKTSEWRARAGVKGFKVESAEMLLRTYDGVAAWAPALLAQEWVPGPGSEQFTCNAYFGEGGVPLATFVTRKLRQWPPSVGTGASGIECRNDEVLATTLRLFGDLDFRGFGYLEMKRDARTGRMVIIEPNVGRPTGRSATAEAGGVELVYTAYCDATGRPLPASRQQMYTGARWVDLRRDLQAATVARRQGELRLRDWLRWTGGARAHAIWSLRDPLPFLVDVTRASRVALRMLVRRDASGELPRQAPTAPRLRRMEEARASELP